METILEGKGRKVMMATQSYCIPRGLQSTCCATGREVLVWLPSIAIPNKVGKHFFNASKFVPDRNFEYL